MLNCHLSFARYPSGLCRAKMDSTPPPPDSPVGIAHLIGSPAGRALASKVEEACRMVQPLEISDEEYAARGDWAPPIPVSIILRQVLRPAVFVLQQALDPSFHRVGYGRFEFPVSTTQMVQGSLRKLMELVVRSVSSRSGVLLFLLPFDPFCSILSRSRTRNTLRMSLCGTACWESILSRMSHPYPT